VEHLWNGPLFLVAYGRTVETAARGALVFFPADLVVALE
jgi:hypothetical protein